MNLIRMYFSTFFGMMTDTTTYRRILSWPLKASIAFTLTSLLLFGIYEAVLFSTQVFPNVTREARGPLLTAFQGLPDDAVVSLRDNQFVTENLSTPFLVPLEQSGRELFGAEYLLSLSPDGPVDSVIDIETDRMRLRWPGQDMEQYLRFADAAIPGFRLTKQQLIDETNRFFDELPTFAAAMSIALAIASMLGLLLFLLFFVALASVATQVVGSFAGLRLPYQKYVQLGLHVGILALLIEEVGRQVMNSAASSLFALSYVALMICVLLSLRMIKYNT